MFASRVNAFSSQFGGEGSVMYTMNNLVGPPDVYPNYGDSPDAASFVNSQFIPIKTFLIKTFLIKTF